MLKNMVAQLSGVRPIASRGGFHASLEHCHGLGLGAVRMNPLFLRPGSGSRAAQRRSINYGMRVIISLPPPKEAAGAAGIPSRRARGQRARCRHHWHLLHRPAV